MNVLNLTSSMLNVKTSGAIQFGKMPILLLKTMSLM